MLARHFAPLAALALLTVASPRLHAQDTTAHPASWLVGAGINAATGAGVFPALQLGREWRAPNSRFGLRLEGEFTGASSRTYSIYGLSGPDIVAVGSSTQSSRALSLGLLTTFALTKGRIQPYLISGFSLQRSDSREVLVDFSNPSGTPGGGTLGFAPGSYDRSSTELGVQAGLGVQARVGSAWVFAESKSHLPLEYSTTRRVHALTFGLRF